MNNRIWIRLSLVFLFAGIVFWRSGSVSLAQTVPADSDPTILVQFRADLPGSERDRLIAETGGELANWMPQLHVAEIRLPLEKATSAYVVNASALYASFDTTAPNSPVHFVEYDLPIESTYFPNDPALVDVDKRYALELTHVLGAWNKTTGNGEVIIAILDSGVNVNHPEFAGRIVEGYDFVHNDNDPGDDTGHGTHSAGIAAAGIDNGNGMVGVCPGCKVLPVKVLNEHGTGTWSTVARGILYAVDKGARVISLSLGAPVSSRTMEAAVAYARERNVLIVAAAGNFATDKRFYPAAIDDVFAVSATDASDSLWTLSNYGSYIDVAAPGHLIYSTYHDLQNQFGGYMYMSGTSMAAPFVAGLAGLLFSVDPNRSLDSVVQSITQNADDLGPAGWDPQFGHGRINAAKALGLEEDEQFAAGQSGTVGDTETAEGQVGDAPDSLSDQHFHVFLPVLSNQ